MSADTPVSAPWGDIEASWSVFPLPAHSKAPARPWLGQARPLAEWPDAELQGNLGVDCGASSLVVVDEDRPGAVKEWLSSAGAPYSTMPLTCTVETAKGRHYYFAYNHADAPIGNRVGVFPGVDIRGKGGYVVAPGSTHETGAIYRRLVAVPAVPLPGWLAELVTGPSARPASTPGPTQHAQQAPAFRLPEVIENGTRNDTLFRYACSLVGRRVDFREALKLLEDAYGRCATPYTDEKARHMLLRATRTYGDPAAAAASASPAASPARGSTLQDLDDELDDAEAEALWRRSQLVAAETERLGVAYDAREAHARARGLAVARDISSGFVSGAEFVFDTPESPEPVWGDQETVLWADGEALLVVGPSGVGKTSLVGQLVRARIAGGDVLGLPVAPTGSKVLYLAMDRPKQIARALKRPGAVGGLARELVDEHLVIWPGPPPADVAQDSSLLARMCEKAGADTLIVDSLKDAAVGLSEDAVGAGYNRARQEVLKAGVQVVELHHQVKRSADGGAPKRLSDVYGSVWITAGAGSVVLLWGEPGDPVVELRHLKQPHAEFGPVSIVHDHAEGTSALDMSSSDPLELLRDAGDGGLEVADLATAIYGEDSKACLQKVRRRLKGLADDGLVYHEGKGTRQSPLRWFATATTVVIEATPMTGGAEGGGEPCAA